MPPKVYMLFLLLSTIVCHAQNFMADGVIGSFNSAKSISINASGSVYVADEGKNEIIKLDTLGNVLKTIGGYGWSEGSFDMPTDLFTNVLNVYAADKNNNRIQLFDKDLNFISQFSTENFSNQNFSFKYPTGVAVSSQGELFILDSDNRRILKFSSGGEFQFAIGSIDAGKFQLTHPNAFCIDSKNNLIVLEESALIIFDQFGNGIRKVEYKNQFTNISFSAGNLFLISCKKIVVEKIDTGIQSLGNSSNEIETEEEILDASLYRDRIYMLAKDKILIYKMINKSK